MVLQLSRDVARIGLPFCALLLLAHCGGSELTLPSDTAPVDLVLVDGDQQNGAAGEALARPLLVKVTDRRGQPVRGQRVAFALMSEAPGARLNPDTAETAANGQAEARWTLGSASGTQRVVARVVGMNGLEVSFEAKVGSHGAARLQLVSGDNQTAAVGTALRDSLVVRVLDDFDNPVAGTTVEWAASGGSVDPASVVTGPDGRAATRRILGSSIGSPTTTASSGDLAGSPVTFTSHAAAGTASELVQVSGDNQSAHPGDQLPEPLVVRLVDRDGNGVPGRAVSWVVGIGGGHVESPTSTTGSDGEASTRWTLGSAGPNTLNAVVSGVGVVAFSAQASSGGGGGGDGGQADHLEFRVQPSKTKEGKKISPPVEVAVLDRNGNRVTSQEIKVNLELVGERDGRLRGGTTQRTKSGLATFSDLKIEKDGDYRLRASADGLPSVNSDEFEVYDD